MLNDDEELCFGRYRALKLLGEGAMGRVYLAEDPILKRQVAVKVIPTDRSLDEGVLRGYLERLAAEAQACARLNHPSIVSIYDAGEQDGMPWIAFEYVSGEHLDLLIARQKQLPIDRVARIAGDIAAAMRHAHGMKIVHRDIKPANILIDDASGVAKLADFGVVKSPFTTITLDEAAVGSPGYMSPEQIDNLEVDARSDIFSFGIVLYEMLTGTHPFLRDTMQATFFATLSCAYTPIDKLREDVPEKLARIVEKALVADRNLRIINADELCSMVAGCLSDSAHAARVLRARGTGGGIPSRIKYAYAVVLRQLASIWKKTPPGFRNAMGSAGYFCRERVFAPAGEAIGSIRAKLLKRFSKTQLAIAMAGAASVAAAIVLILLIAAASARTSDKKRFVKAAQEIGYSVKGGKQLIDTCRAYLEKCDHPRAEQIADILLTGKDKHYALQGRMLKAMSALCAERINDAAALFKEAGSLEGGENAIRKEHPFYIRYLENRIDRELPEPLVNLCAEQLFLHNNFQLRTWAKNEHYWIRWNAVRIMQKGGAQVDLVQIYILDLDHSGSARTKIRAAERLGELGDRRAVPALISTRDGKGPAAGAARTVLREKFNIY